MGIARVHQREQSEGRVAQPAETVVPIAGAAQLLRQRGGRRRDNAAAWLKNESAQREQGTDHSLRPLPRAFEWLRPGAPVPFGLFERLEWIDGAGHTLVGNAMAQRKIDRFPGVNGELAEMGPASWAKSYGCPQDQAVGPRDGPQTSVVVPAYPRHDRAVTETDNELGVQFDAAAYAAHQANKMRALDFRGHEIGDNGNAAVRLNRGFENQSMAAIGAGNLGARIGGHDRPSAIVCGAEEIGETGGRIEARPAKPIDGKVAPDEGGRLAIADDRVVFDVQGHAPASGVKIRAKTYLSVPTHSFASRFDDGQGFVGSHVIRIQMFVTEH